MADVDTERRWGSINIIWSSSHHSDLDVMRLNYTDINDIITSDPDQAIGHTQCKMNIQNWNKTGTKWQAAHIIAENKCYTI